VTRRLLDKFLDHGIYRALRHREYRLLCYAQTSSSMGGWMDEVARGWLIYLLTDSMAQLGLVRGVQAIPFLLLAPIAGSVADRFSRRNLLVLTQGLHALVFAITAWLIFTEDIRVWHVYVGSFVVGLVHVFQQPARGAMISGTVPRESLTNAIGFNSLVFNIARTTGPALAGAVIVVIGMGGTYLLQGFFMALAVWWTYAMRSDANAPLAAGETAPARESFMQSILEGWRFSWRNQAVRASLACAMLVSFFIVPFTTLMPVFARDLLQVGAGGQGVLLGCIGAGAFLSAATITLAGERLPRGLMMLASVAVYGVIVIAFAFSPWYAFSIMLMLCAGLCQPLSNALVQTVIQSHAPRELHGRTMALFSMHMVLITVGSMALGALAEWVGPRWSMALMGAAGILSILAVHLAMPRARYIR
jgi:MFS family permease